MLRGEKMLILISAVIAAIIILTWSEVIPAEKWFRKIKARLIGFFVRSCIYLVDWLDRVRKRLES